MNLAEPCYKPLHELYGGFSNHQTLAAVTKLPLPGEERSDSRDYINTGNELILDQHSPYTPCRFLIRSSHISYDNVASSPVIHNPRHAPSSMSSQLPWLIQGLMHPDGLLPLFDSKGRRISAQRVRLSINRGWVVPWQTLSLNPPWYLCRLTLSGYQFASLCKKSLTVPKAQ